jgi:hypothetical protein
VEPKKKFYYFGNSRLNSFVGKFNVVEEASILSSINDDQLLLSITDYELGLPRFLRLDFSHSPRNLLEFEASKLEKKVPSPDGTGEENVTCRQVQRLGPT